MGEDLPKRSYPGDEEDKRRNTYPQTYRRRR